MLGGVWKEVTFMGVLFGRCCLADATGTKSLHGCCHGGVVRISSCYGGTMKVSGVVG